MTTLLILSGFYIIWLAALLTVAYTPRPVSYTHPPACSTTTPCLRQSIVSFL